MSGNDRHERVYSFSDDNLSKEALGKTTDMLYASPPNNVSLIGKFVFLRTFYNSPSKNQVHDYGRKTTHVTLADADGRSITIIFFNFADDISRLVGSVVEVGPVDIKDKNPSFDGTRNTYTAFARNGIRNDSRKVTKRTTTFKELTPANTTELDSELINAIRTSTKFFPAVFELNEVRGGMCHNLIPVVFKRFTKPFSPLSKNIEFEVMDDHASAMVGIDTSHESPDGSDVYALDVKDKLPTSNGVPQEDEAVRANLLKPGTVVLLYDFKGELELTERDEYGIFHKATRKLVSTPQSRLFVGVRNVEIASRLKPICEAILVDVNRPIDDTTSFADNNLSRSPSTFLNVSDIQSIITSSINDIHKITNGQIVQILGVLEDLVPSYSSYTRMKCPNNYKHSNFEKCDGEISHFTCTDCGPFAKVECVFDVSICVREKGSGGKSTVLKTSRGCVSNRLLQTSADRFDSLTDSEKENIIARVTGKTEDRDGPGNRLVILNVWCKSDGYPIVLDAFPLEAREEKADYHDQSKKSKTSYENACALQF